MVMSLVSIIASCGAGDGGSNATRGGVDGGPGAATSDGDTGDPTEGGSNVAPTGPTKQICAGRYHTCALRQDGTIYCWGQGAYRQLGGDYGAQHVARKVDGIDDARAIDCGDRFTCVVRGGGAAFCFGDNDHGQAGTANTNPCGDSTIDSICVPTPQPVVGLESDVVELALGNEHGCARRGDGSVVCWGNDALGQVGDPALGDVRAPRLVPGIGSATRIVAGDEHTCVLAARPGPVTCWGANDSGQSGHGPIGNAPGPLPGVVDGITDAVELVAGGEHTCAIRATGEVMCWGYDYLGQLGNGSTRPTRTISPQKVVNLAGATHLAAGRYHTCARKGDGTVACWGEDGKGELGDGSTINQAAPVGVTGVKDTQLVTAGAWHSCAAIADGRIMCWGDDLGAQLGDDRVSRDPTPNAVAVKGLP